MESVLKMNPKMMMYGKIDRWEIETEIEKALPIVAIFISKKTKMRMILKTMMF